MLVFGVLHYYAGDVASVPGRRCCRTARNRLHAGEMAVSRFSSPVIMCRQRLLKPFKIRDTVFVRFHALHEWVNVEHIAQIIKPKLHVAGKPMIHP